LGIKVHTSGVVTDFLVDGCTFTSNTGGGIYSDTATPTSGFTGVNLTNFTLSDSTFTGNGAANNQAGVYIERLNNGVITRNTFTNNGIATNPRAMIVNLKFAAYSAISVTENIGTETRGGVGTSGVGLFLAARNDGASYSPVPASLSNATISNNEFSGFHNGITLANDIEWATATVANNSLSGGINGLVAYGADAGSTLVAADNSITGQSSYHIANGDAGSSINAESNWFGTTAGHVIAAKIAGNVDYNPWRLDGTDTSANAGFQPAGVATGTPVVATITGTTSPLCPSGSTGTASVSASGGSTPYSYSWSTGASTTTATGLSAGSYTVTVTDANGTQATATATVIDGVDVTAPVIAPCVAPQTYEAGVGCAVLLPNLTGLLSATDDCTAVTVTQSPVAGTSLARGTHNVTFTVADAYSNTSTCVAVVTVVDTTAPVITECAPDFIANANTNCVASLPDLRSSVVASDDCSTTRTQSPVAGTQLAPGVHPVTITVTDAAGNTATCVTNFTVRDIRVPTIAACAPAQTLSVGATGTVALPDFTTTVTAADNCGIVSTTQVPAAGTTYGLGTVSVTVTVADAAGNTAACTTSFTAVDTTAPIVTTCPTSQTVSASATCDAILPDFTSEVVATDNVTAAGSLVITQVPVAGTVVAKGTTNVTVTVADAAGNTSTCAVVYQVNDTTAR
jgi:hypothetical protein